MTNRNKHMQQAEDGPQQSLMFHNNDLHSAIASTSSPKLNVTVSVGQIVIFVLSTVAASGLPGRESKQRYVLQPPQEVTLT